MLLPQAAIAPILLLAAAIFLAAFEKSNPPTGISPNPFPKAGACAVQKNSQSSALFLQPAKKMWQLTAGVYGSADIYKYQPGADFKLEPVDYFLCVAF